MNFAPGKRIMRRMEFDELLVSHKRILYKICNLYCRNEADREDLAQEIIVQLWQAYPRFDERCRFSTWMYRVALNVAISFARNEGRRSAHQGVFDEAVLDVAAPVASDAMSLLHTFIGRLGDLDKALILLYLDGNIYAEMTEVLGISETNASTRISRLKSVMKKEMA